MSAGSDARLTSSLLLRLIPAKEGYVDRDRDLSRAARSDCGGGSTCLKLVTALPWREYRSDSIQWSSMDRDQPLAVACRAYQVR
jgi:hypothetical protein